MIDFHSNLLPGVDDGSDSVETSLRMLEFWEAPALICATPHFFADRDEPERFFRRRAAAWEVLSAALPAGSPDIRLGVDVHYFDSMSRSEVMPALCLEGKRLLLLELPFGIWSRRVYTELEQVRQRGQVSVVAHVERYLAWNGGGALELLEDQGVLFRCNAEFILTNGAPKRRCGCWRMAESGFSARTPTTPGSVPQSCGRLGSASDKSWGRAH